MDKFSRELASGEINIRDRWQFELKAEFFPYSEASHRDYTQEFYFFTPRSLQINAESYSKANFYSDQTTLIRYKTPVLSFQELTDPGNDISPINRLYAMERSGAASPNEIEEELKLFGNIIRSALRRRVKTIVDELEFNHTACAGITEKIIALSIDWIKFRQEFQLLTEELSLSSHPVSKSLLYVNQFVSGSACHYLTGLLSKIRNCLGNNFQNADSEICEILIEEQKIAEKNSSFKQKDQDEGTIKEYMLYKHGLLNKFILDALLLNTTRTSPDERFKNVAGSVAAGIAMFFYVMFFIWQGQVFVLNSEPFVLATVVLYVIKDRLKEGLRSISYRKALKWFSDYTTKILSPDGNATLGKLKESFSFIHESKLPEEIVEIRNREFHAVLEEFHRPESVMYYKRKIEMFRREKEGDCRRYGLNIIYRFNILRFLRKADDPTHSYLTLDPNTLNFLRQTLPKVYHLNIIIKNSFRDKSGVEKVEFKKFRLILDKNGIKRIENLQALTSSRLPM